tara:strand:+ start:1611 stop:2546 length:936 start_codon:yes stop_codon:yes gene_type:complete
MSNTTDSVNNDGLSQSTLEVCEQDESYISGRRGAGIFCDYMTEAIPDFIDANCEKKINRGNSWIILGRDRPASRASGYGGQGHTQASSIDIVVGRNPNSTVSVDPSFSNDAARIYISQKTDLDINFGITPNPATPDNPWQAIKSQLNSRSVSGIGIKADAVRIVGDMGIKLVTRTSATNSKGGSIAPNGIELIANNDDNDLQPMIKGENMVEALAGLEEKIAKLSALVLNFLKDQTSYNNTIAAHTHIAPPAGPTTPSIELVPAGINAAISTAEAMVDNFKGRMNMNISWHSKYLSPMSEKYICSKYNKVN